MDALNTFTSWLFASWTAITSVVYSQWGILGSFLFAAILLRKLIKVFKKTF